MNKNDEGIRLNKAWYCDGSRLPGQTNAAFLSVSLRHSKAFCKDSRTSFSKNVKSLDFCETGLPSKNARIISSERHITAVSIKKPLIEMFGKF